MMKAHKHFDPLTTRKFTILHSNDMHGDFFSDDKSVRGELIGGLARLSGYINKVRAEEENVLYVISGDMLQGSLIDTEYKGISTIEIMNYLAPDVVALGNHEFDYGLPQLLFLEKMANFPIVNANLYIKNYNRRLMQPYKIITKAGFQLLFTGIITEKVIDAIKQDKLIGSFVTLQDAGREVGQICNAYKNDDIDLTVLLTHIGLESDIELAKILKPEWGVDMIIGGHSHTYLDKPKNVNGILIAHAGTGTDQIGRFDIVIDDATNKIVASKWKLVKIDNRVCKPDKHLAGFISSFRAVVDHKYQAVVCKLGRKLTHPKREVETSLGNLFADAFAEAAQADIALVGSGSIRSKELGPLVTLNDVLTCFPYDDSLTRFSITGAQLQKMFAYFMRFENRDGEGENYQINNGVKAIYNDSGKNLESLTINGKPVVTESYYTICLQGFHLKNSQKYLNISETELLASGQTKVISTSAQEIFEAYLRSNQNTFKDVEGRLTYRK